MKKLQFCKESYIYINPITKIVAFILSSFLMMSSGNTIIENIIIGIMLILVLNTKAYKIFLGFLITSLIFIFIDWAVCKYNLPIIFFAVSKIGKMFLPTFMGFYILSKETSSSDFMSAFNSVKLPKAIQIPFVVMLRFIPTVQEALKDVRKALRIRGFDKKTLIKHPIFTMEYLIVPTLMSCSRSMDELASAAICRGFSNEKSRTYLVNTRVGIIDILIIMIYVGILLRKRVIA